MRRVPDITKINKMLGFQPKYTLEAGLKETIKWQLERRKKLNMPKPANGFLFNGE